MNFQINHIPNDQLYHNGCLKATLIRPGSQKIWIMGRYTVNNRRSCNVIIKYFQQVANNCIVEKLLTSNCTLLSAEAVRIRDDNKSHSVSDLPEDRFSNRYTANVWLLSRRSIFCRKLVLTNPDLWCKLQMLVGHANCKTSGQDVAREADHDERGKCYQR